MFNRSSTAIYSGTAVPLHCSFLTADAVRGQATKERAFVLSIQVVMIDEAAMLEHGWR